MSKSAIHPVAPGGGQSVTDVRYAHASKETERLRPAADSYAGSALRLKKRSSIGVERPTLTLPTDDPIFMQGLNEMTGKDTNLLAAFWTIAGDTHPDDAEWISPDSLEVRAEAASKAGWKGIGLSLDDCRYSVQKYGAAGVRRLLDDNGLEFFELEILMDWYATDGRREASNRARKEFLEFGGELGMCNLKVGVSHLDLSPTNHSQMADEFAKLCEDFGTINATVGLEFMPFCKVASLADALPVVQGANQANGGLIIDIWHVVRSGTTFDDVAAVPANLIKGIELNDANASAIGSLMNDSTHHRKACGEGEFDCPSFIDAVRKAGFHQKYWGVEILSDFLRKAPVDVRAKHVYDTTIAQFDAV